MAFVNKSGKESEFGNKSREYLRITACKIKPFGSY